MWERDIFVACLSAGIGGGLVICAGVDHARFFAHRTPAMLTAWFGRAGARGIISLIGLGLVVMAIWIIYPHWN